MYKAIENEEFHMYLQPKFQISSLNVVSAEALVRWFSPELGFYHQMNLFHCLKKVDLLLNWTFIC